MKVPKMYKSSDRYNAGTDVIYNDDSKLQYAPFIYAGVTAKDNGGDDGGDEEGEDTMYVELTSTGADAFVSDKTAKEIIDAVTGGKVIVFHYVQVEEGFPNVDHFGYITKFSMESSDNSYYFTIYRADQFSPIPTMMQADSIDSTLHSVEGGD